MNTASLSLSPGPRVGGSGFQIYDGIIAVRVWLGNGKWPILHLRTGEIPRKVAIRESRAELYILRF
jgi:hypothetical protein